MHSDDGRWWWDGRQWRPAYAPDGRSWFDGETWQFVPGAASPRPRSRGARWTRIALVASSIAAFVGLFAYGVYAYATHDHIDLLDRPDVADAADAACRTATVSLEQRTGDRAADVRAGNTAIDGLVRGVSSLGEDTLEDDLPAADWLTDWTTLAGARAEFAERLSGDPDASFDVPQTEDGYPITGRMSWAAGPDCARAVEVAGTP